MVMDLTVRRWSVEVFVRIYMMVFIFFSRVKGALIFFFTNILQVFELK